MHVVVEVKQSLRSVVAVGVLGASLSFGIALGIDAISHQARSACPVGAALPGAPCLAAWRDDDAPPLESGARSPAVATVPVMDTLMAEARIVPAVDGSRAIGFKVFSIRSSSLLDRAGLKNGDIVTHVNGYEMTDPAKALEIYAKLRDARVVVIDIIRRGQPATITIDTASFEK
jgi:S1-C subfamily serine protease